MKRKKKCIHKACECFHISTTMLSILCMKAECYGKYGMQKFFLEKKKKLEILLRLLSLSSVWYWLYNRTSSNPHA